MTTKKIGTQTAALANPPSLAAWANVVGQEVPFFGLYGACSTMGEGLALAAMTLDGGFGEWAAVTASSHFCSAERQYRTPLEYGGQRTPTSQWTATAAGAAVLAREGPGPYITHVTVGKIVDKGVTDTNNMGAAMAPAAFDTIISHFNDTGRSPGSYDMIFTGDLGTLGSELLVELLRKSGIQVKNHGDCGAMLFDIKNQEPSTPRPPPFRGSPSPASVTPSPSLRRNRQVVHSVRTSNTRRNILLK